MTIPDHNVAVYMYTSGSTGVPKAVELTYANLGTKLEEWKYHLNLNKGDIMLGYLPLAHVLELVAELYCWLNQHIVAYSNGMPKAQDLAVLKPHMMPVVPLVLDRMLSGILDEARKQGKFLFAVFQRALRLQVWLWQNFEWYPRILHLLVPIKSRMGGNLKYVICGGSKLSNATYSKLTVLGLTIHNAYGLTETTGGAIIEMGVDRLHVGVGTPLVYTKFMLEDVPEMDKWVRNRQGLIWVSGPSICQGYHKRPELKKSFIEHEGRIWFNTGDIGELRDGTLVIIDRQKDLVKLQNGEYVSLSEVETIFSEYSEFSQVCFQVTDENGLIAYVVPRHSGKQPAIQDVQTWAAKKGIPTAKTPKKLIFCQEFTVENGMLTPTRKVVRHKVYENYQ